MEIVPATQNHLEPLLELGSVMHSESGYSEIPIDLKKLERFYCRHLQEESSLFLVVEGQEHLQGMFIAALDYYFFANELMAQDLIFFLRKPLRGSRAATKIVGHYMNWCKEKNVREACLSTSTGIKPEKTCSFYEAVGFNQVGYINKFNFQRGGSYGR